MRDNTCTSEGDVSMGQIWSSASETRETPGEICVAVTHDEQRFAQGRSDNKGHRSPPPTDFTHIKGKEFQLHRPNDADGDSLETLSCTKDEGNSPEKSEVNFEESRGLLDSHSPMTSTDSSGIFNPPAKQQDTVVSRTNLTWVRASLEGRLDANFQETLKLREALKTAFLRWENDFLVQNSSLSRKEDEVAALQREIQNLRGFAKELCSRVARVMQAQEMVSKLKTEFQSFRQDVSKCPNRDDVLEQVIGKSVGQLYRHKLALHEDLRECRTQLESARQDVNSKTSEIEVLNENKLILEEANRQLEQKVEMIQQQLCKEKSGHHGSYVDGSQTPFLLETTAKDMFSSIATFSSLLSKYTDPNGYNSAQGIVVASDLCKRVSLLRPGHWTYILKNCICNALFENFQSETFAASENAVLFLDPEQRGTICFEYFNKCKIKGVGEKAVCQRSNDKFDSLFFEYFASKASQLLPWDIQPLICEVFKNHEHLIGTRLYERLSSSTPDIQRLVQSLIQAAEKVWQFHKLCLSFEPPATIFRVSSGYPFHQDYMEATDELENDGSNSVPTVGFTIYPGFRLRKSIIKCEVYLAMNT